MGRDRCRCLLCCATAGIAIVIGPFEVGELLTDGRGQLMPGKLELSKRKSSTL